MASNPPVRDRRVPRGTTGTFGVCTLAQWLEADGVDLRRIPKVADHRRRMSGNPVVARVIAAELAAS